jgi:hypothetical protein
MGLFLLYHLAHRRHLKKKGGKRQNQGQDVERHSQHSTVLGSTARRTDGTKDEARAISDARLIH